MAANIAPRLHAYKTDEAYARHVAGDFQDVHAKRIARRIRNTTYDHGQHVKYEETVLANATAAYIEEQWTLASRLGITAQVQALVDAKP